VRMLDLFSGIGGFHLAAEWVWGDDLEVVAHCEIDKFCQKVLKKHWPDIPIIEDIRGLNGKEYGTIDLITGGFPCQPYSVAGKRKGKEDDRNLWPEMFRVISEVRPAWIIGENVANLQNFLEFEHICTDLESIEYEVQPLIIPAAGVGARHRRDRIWILAYSKRDGWRRRNNGNEKRQKGTLQIKGSCTGYKSKLLADTTEQGLEGEITKGKLPGEQSGLSAKCGWQYWSTEPNVGRVAHGISARVDRLKSLGNAIVPQVAAVIMQAIKEGYNAKIHIPL